MRLSNTHRHIPVRPMAMIVLMLMAWSCSAGSKQQGVFAVYKSQEGYDAMMSLYRQYLSKWPVPYQEIDVETTWGTTHVIKSGVSRGAPVVVLHGGGSNAALTCLADLARDNAVYTVDIMGDAGKSVPRAIPMNANEVAQWLNEVLAGLKIERATVIGLSYGAYAGQRLLAYYPEKVRGLVMLHYAYIDQMPPLLTIARMIWHSSRNDRAGVRALLAIINGGPLADRAMQKTFEDHFLTVGRHCRQERANMYDAIPAAEVKSVNRPVLVIIGEKDPLFDAKKAQARWREINNPAIRFELVSGMGHLPMDHLPQIMARIHGFLKEIEADRPAAEGTPQR